MISDFHISIVPKNSPKTKSRVALLTTFYEPEPLGGAEGAVNEIVNGLCDEFDMTLITSRLSKSESKFEDNGKFKIVRLGVGVPQDKLWYPWLATKYVRQHDFELVHGVMESYAGMATAFCAKKHARTLLTLQSPEVEFMTLKNRGWQKFFKWIHNAPAELTAISQQVAERAQKLAPEKVVHYIPNGVDLSIFASGEQGERDPEQIIFWGRLARVKGIDVLLRALAQMKNQTAKLKIIGAGPEEKNLRELCTALELDARVEWLGFQNHQNIARLARQSTIFAGASRWEALGNVFIEAQAAGCIPMGTAIGGIPDIVKNGKTGFLVPVEDEQKLAEVLDKILADKKLQNEIRKNLPASAAGFAWPKQIAKYRKVYQNMLQK